jgi:hypothetical protein
MSVDVIINWPGNNLNLAKVGDLSNPNIEPGTFLVIPGGSREFVNWSAPRIRRDNPSVAKILGTWFLRQDHRRAGGQRSVHLAF